MALSGRVSPQAHESVVIASGDQLPIMREVNVVDMRAIRARGEDAVDEPSKFGIVRCPERSGSV